MPARFWFWLAYRMPRALAYFCAVRVFAAGMRMPTEAVPKPVPPTIEEALTLWGRPE